MPPQPIGDRPMTDAERQAVRRDNKAMAEIRFYQAMRRISRVKSAEKAREIAREALGIYPEPAMPQPRKRSARA